MVENKAAYCSRWQSICKLLQFKMFAVICGTFCIEQNRKPLNGLVVNAGSCCVVLPFADTLVTICVKQWIGRAHAIEMDLSMLKPHAVFFTCTQIFIDGTSVSCSADCLGQKWINDFRRHILEKFLIFQILKECPAFYGILRFVAFLNMPRDYPIPSAWLDNSNILSSFLSDTCFIGKVLKGGFVTESEVEGQQEIIKNCHDSRH